MFSISSIIPFKRHTFEFAFIFASSSSPCANEKKGAWVGQRQLTSSGGGGKLIKRNGTIVLEMVERGDGIL